MQGSRIRLGLLLAVTFFLVVYAPLPSSPCNTQLPGLGPRLMKAKVLFGNVMRSCAKEITAAARKIPSNMVRKLVFVACSHYNVCKLAHDEERPNATYQCIMGPLQNKTSNYYTALTLRENFQGTFQKALHCLWESIYYVLRDWQRVDDAIAVARAVILNYGWN